MKKFLSVLLCISMLAGMLAACNSGNGSADSEVGEAAYMLRQETVPSASRPAEKKQGRARKQARSSNSFNQFEQNDYDFDELEKELLGS